MGWVIALALIVLLIFLPVGLNASFNDEGFRISRIIGPVRMLRKKKTGKSGKKTTNSAASRDSTRKGGDYKDFLPLLELLVDLLSDFRQKVRINNLKLKLVLAGNDPCDLAINYGRAWAILGNLMPHLEKAFIIKNRNLEVECNFVSDRVLIEANADITITVGRLLRLGLKHGFRIVKEYIRLLNIRKGGAKNEP